MLGCERQSGAVGGSQSGMQSGLTVAVEANGSAPLGVGRSQAVLVRAEAFASRAGAV